MQVSENELLNLVYYLPMRYIAALSIVFCISAAGPLAHGQLPDTFFKDTFGANAPQRPGIRGTTVSRHEYDNRWTDWSKDARDSRRRFFEQRLAQLNSVQVGTSAQDLLTKQVVRYDFEARLEAWDSTRTYSASDSSTASTTWSTPSLTRCRRGIVGITKTSLPGCVLFLHTWIRTSVSSKNALLRA